MLAWLITGIVCICAAMTFAEIAILIPKTGGMVAYLEETFGKKVGFLAGWMQSIVFYPEPVRHHRAHDRICPAALDKTKNH